MRLAALVAAAALACGCAGAGRRAERLERVSARGWAPADATDPAAARRRALADALTRAVEQAAGVSLSARTRVRDGVTTDQRIVADAAGRVRRYRVTGQRADGGLVEVSVEAEVALDGSRPKCVPLSVALEVSDAGAERGLARGLAESGCLRAGGSRPDVRLRASARSYPVRGALAEPFLSYGAEVELRAVDPDTGAVVWAGAGRAAALGADGGSAAGRALEEAGELAAAAASRELPPILGARR